MLLFLLKLLPLLGGVYGCDSPCLCDMDKLDILESIVISMDWDILYVSVPVPYVLFYNFRDDLDRAHYRKEFNDGYGNQAGTYIITHPDGNQTVYQYSSKDGSFKYQAKSQHHMLTARRLAPATVQSRALTIFLPTYETDPFNDTIYLPHTSLKGEIPSRNAFVKIDIPRSCERNDILDLGTYDMIEGRIPLMGVILYPNGKDEDDSKLCFQKVVNLVEIPAASALGTKFELFDLFSVLPLPDERGFSEGLEIKYLHVEAEGKFTMLWGSREDSIARNSTSSHPEVKDDNGETKDAGGDGNVRVYPKFVRVIGDRLDSKTFHRRESRTYVPLDELVVHGAKRDRRLKTYISLPTSNVEEDDYSISNQSREYFWKFLFVKGGVYANGDEKAAFEINDMEENKGINSTITQSKQEVASKHEGKNETGIAFENEPDIKLEGGDSTGMGLESNSGVKSDAKDSAVVPLKNKVAAALAGDREIQPTYSQAAEESRLTPDYLKPRLKNYVQRYMQDSFRRYYGQAVLNELETGMKLPQQVGPPYQAFGTIYQNVEKFSDNESVWFFSRAEFIMFFLIMMAILIITVLRPSSRHRLFLK